MAVLGKIRGLQTVCQRAGIPVPLDAVLRRETSLRLPPGVAPPEATAAAKPEAGAAKQEGGEGRVGKKTTKKVESAVAAAPEEAKPSRKAKAKKASAARAPAAAAQPAASTTTTRVVKTPENWFQWLHLLSPLILMGMGLVYAAYRTVQG